MTSNIQQIGKSVLQLVALTRTILNSFIEMPKQDIHEQISKRKRAVATILARVKGRLSIE